MNALKIQQAILSTDLTNDDINDIADCLRLARKRLTSRKKATFRTGQDVKFTDSRTRRVYEGKITKIKIKYVLVATTQGLFNVPANMLEAA